MKDRERSPREHKCGQIIKEKLKEYLEITELSYRKFEALAGLPTGTISNMVNGNSSNPTIETVLAIADAMNCSIDDLLNRSPKKDKTETDKIDLNELDKYYWNDKIVTEAVEAINFKLKEKVNNITFGKGVLLLNDLFSYSYSKNKLDQDFTNWLLNKL